MCARSEACKGKTTITVSSLQCSVTRPKVEFPPAHNTTRLTLRAGLAGCWHQRAFRVKESTVIDKPLKFGWNQPVRHVNHVLRYM